MNKHTMPPTNGTNAFCIGSEGLCLQTVQSRPLKEGQGLFSTALAHEMRNPLTNISLAVQMIQSIDADGSNQQYLDIILRGTNRLNDLINDLLLPAGEIIEERHFIHEVLNEVLEMTHDRLQLKHIRVAREYAAQDCAIMMDRQKMKIALINIVINAIDAMDFHGELTIVTGFIGDKWVVSIRDNGCGISHSNLKNIFKPFYTSKVDGMGLGLSTTLDILHSNHAEAIVKSEEQKGTRFIISFNRNWEAVDVAF